MHGTFHAHIERGAVTTVSFGALAPTPRRYEWRSTLAVLLAGCCVAAFPVSVARSPLIELRPAAPSQEPSPRPIATSRHAAPTRPTPKPHADRAIGPEPQPQTIRIALPPLAPAAVKIPAVAAVPAPTSPTVVAVSPVTEPAAAAPAPRPVDIAQISDSDVHSLNIPDLHEPGLAAGGGPELSAKIAAMQVTPLPPVRLRDSDRAVLLAEAPTQMTVRIGATALGQVDFHMTDARTIDVKLGNLLDLLSGQYDAAEFARLRASAAADAFVSFDQLRALGLNVRYDPVYDEVRING